ncbi:sensor histidine kinase [Paenibacillus thermotolerans]|uniref:sensor histidine kinase n=1 Tax=Paenibacillus thermotolerans TaxID=3027807 RepID=UPI00236862B6|nr:MULTISPECIES: histidine kinase [unclassified Paenibacillus]
MRELFTFRTIRGKFFLLTTIIIVAPMLVLSFAVYHISAMKLEENAVRNAESSLDMGGLYLDRMVIDLYDLLNVVQGNPQIMQLLTTGNTDEEVEKTAKNEDYRYVRNLKNIRDIMNAITLSKPYITSFIIYHYGAPVDKRLYNSSGNGQSIYLTPYLAKRWAQELSAQDAIVWRDGETLEQNNHIRRNSMIVGKKLKKMTGDYGDLGFILLEIDKEKFYEGLSFLRANTGSDYFITDVNGTVIHTFSESSPPSSNPQILKPGKKYIEQTIVNDRTGWRLTHVMEASQLSADARVIRSITIVVFLLLLLIGWLLALWISNTVTRPLKKLSAMIRSGIPFPQAERHFDVSDEVGQIGFRYIRMIDENKALHKEVYTALLKRKEAEIEALQAQINPHFLYNTLESLHWLAISRKQFDIGEVVGSLGKFFRLAIRKGSDMITVAEELEHAKAYVKVQQFRYKDKLDFYTEVEDETMSCFVPKFILQPVVENCIYHGIKKKDEPGSILISGELREGRLIFRITDDGAGVPPDRLKEVQAALSGEDTGTIYGIKNVNERIRLRFGLQYGVSIDSVYGLYTTVTITLPVLTTSEEERMYA